MAIVIGLLVLAVAEITVLVALASATSWIATFLIVVLVGAVGAWIVKREGTSTWRRITSGVRAGQVPTTGLLDGALVMVAGVLLLLPGLLSDVAALALAVPPIRARVRDAMVDHFQKRITARASRARSTTVFGFGSPGSPFGAAGFGAGAGFGAAGFGQGFGADGRRVDDDVIDLDGEEVDLIDLPRAELEPPQDRTA